MDGRCESLATAARRADDQYTRSAFGRQRGLRPRADHRGRIAGELLDLEPGGCFSPEGPYLFV
jgi:hypothetical protein